MKKKYLIVGSGFAGAVLARELAEMNSNHYVEVIDSREHIGGNCYTEKDPETGIMIHKYGPHIFHTSREDVWHFVNRFAQFGNYINRVKADTEKGVFSLPLNLLTINQFYGKKFSPSEAKQFFASISNATPGIPQNFEEQALKFLGRDIYENFFYGYTKKQWGCEPKELPASILKRLPVRFNYDDNYYNSKYQGIPVNGYTSLIENILSHPQISTTLNCDFNHINHLYEFEHVFYSGSIDQYFNFNLGNLSYRTIYFEKIVGHGDYLGNAVINHTSMNIPYTRVHEHKHFTPWAEYEKTVVLKEFSKETGVGDIPYYPKRLESDKLLLAAYTDKALMEKKISFIGRLGTYRYLDMHQVIGESIDFAQQVYQCLQNKKAIPVFSHKID